MAILAPTTRFAGEVSERAELLNGAMQLTLDGGALGSGDEWTIEAALSWRLGRAGAVPLDEGDLTLTHRDAELVAILDDGVAELDEDTGAIEVSAAFEIEGATGLDLDADVVLRSRFEIGAETWDGELALAGSDATAR